jgi:O-antigen ligase
MPARFALGFAVLMCVAPFVLGIHVLPLPTFFEEWLAAALGTASCVAVLFAVRRRAVLVPQTVLPVIGLLGVLALQLALGKTAYGQQVTLVMLYVLFAMVMVWCGLALRELVGIENVSRVIAAALLAGGVFSAVLAIVQAYAPVSWIGGFAAPLVNPRAYGNLGQANLLADQLALAAASLLYLHATNALRAWSAIVLAIVLAVALTLSGSRSVWLYGAWLLVWTLFMHFRSSDARHARSAGVVVAALVALALLAFTLPPVVGVSTSPASVGSGLERLAAFSIDAGRGSSEGLRFYFWQHAWEMFKSAPLIGIGAGQFPFAFFEQSILLSDGSLPGQERNAHNIMLQLLAETGLFGAVFVLVTLGLWFWRALSTPPDMHRWWIVAVAGIVVLHSFLEYPLWYAHFLGPFALLLGLGETRPVVPQRARLVWLVLVGVVVLGAAVLGSLVHGFVELRRWIYLVPEEALRDPAVVTRQQEAVVRLQPTLLGPYVDLPLAGTIRLDRENIEAKLAFNERVLRFAPIAPVVLRHVALLALAGREDEAKKLLDVAAVVYPADLAPFAADLQRLAGQGLPVQAIAAYLAEKQRKN